MQDKSCDAVSGADGSLSERSPSISSSIGDDNDYGDDNDGISTPCKEYI